MTFSAVNIVFKWLGFFMVWLECNVAMVRQHKFRGAKEIYNEYIDFLNEMRVSENEIIEFSRWFMNEMETNVSNIVV